MDTRTPGLIPPLQPESKTSADKVTRESFLSLPTTEPEMEHHADNASDASVETPQSAPSVVSPTEQSSAPTTTDHEGSSSYQGGDVLASGNVVNRSTSRHDGVSHRPLHPSDIGNWAPLGQVAFPSGISQLPDLATSTSITSYNIGYVSPLQREMEESISSLLSEKVFEELMNDSLGRHRFREYLINTGGDIASLDLWSDLRAYRSMTDKVKNTALAIHELFTLPDGGNRGGAITNELREDILTSLRQGMLVGDSLDPPQQGLISILYRNEFTSFIKHKLIENATVRLGQVGLTDEEKRGLGDAFCLTNPRLKDHPIVLVSPGFEKLTGYQAKFITGRNCRMLAGPATNQLTTQRISTALRRGEGINTLILNYRASGEPFWNLLCILPLRGANSSNVTYFIGGQTEVSGILAKGSHLSFLVGSEQDPSPSVDSSEDFSPALKNISAAIAMGGGSLPMGGSLSVGIGGGGSSDRNSVPLAGGQSKVGRTNQFQGIVEKKGIRGFWQVVAGGKRREVPIKGEDQQFAGAEAMFDQIARPVDIQIAAFAQVYSKVIIFRRVNREIIFVTSAFLAFCGLPHTTSADVCRSSLLHNDLMTLIGAPEPVDAKFHRRKIKDAIARGISLSIEVEVRMHSKKKTLYDVGGKRGVLHLTPLMDRDGVVEACVAIIGS